MIHNLKIEPVYYDAIEAGDKTFEVRWNEDRGFQKGDTVFFQAYRNACYDSSRRDIKAEITYVTNFKQQEGWVVFGFKKSIDEFEFAPHLAHLAKREVEKRGMEAVKGGEG